MPGFIKVNKKILHDLFGSFEIPDIFKGKYREGPVVLRKEQFKSILTTLPDSPGDMGFIVLQEMSLYFPGTMKVTKLSELRQLNPQKLQQAGVLAFFVLKENQYSYKDEDNADPISHAGFLIDGAVVSKHNKTRPEIGIRGKVI